MKHTKWGRSIHLPFYARSICTMRRFFCRFASVLIISIEANDFLFSIRNQMCFCYCSNAASVLPLWKSNIVTHMPIVWNFKIEMCDKNHIIRSLKRVAFHLDFFYAIISTQISAPFGTTIISKYPKSPWHRQFMKWQSKSK